MTTEPPQTPPSTDHDEPEHTAADLLDDDGTIDVSKVKSITNAGQQNTSDVSPAECRRFRRTVAEGTSPRQIDTDWNKSAVRYHVTGKCNHDVSIPTFEYDRENEQWVVGE